MMNDCRNRHPIPLNAMGSLGLDLKLVHLPLLNEMGSLLFATVDFANSATEA